MNFHPQEVPLSRNQPLGPTALQIEDLNSLIDSLKRREENIIQLLDYNLKFKSSTNHMDVVHLRGLYIQLGDREKKRIEHEDATIVKYVDFHINDEYQKKLLTKMKNKISQLYSSAKEKLVQLGIFTHTKQAYMGIATFEETLGLVLSQFPIDVHFFLNCLIQSSRKRFSDEIDPNTPSLEGPKQKSLETSLMNVRQQQDNTLPKMILQKTASPVPNKEESKPRENFRVRNIEPSSLSAKELSKMARSSATVRSVDSRPSFDFKEDVKAAYDMLGVQKSSYSNSNNFEVTTRPESNVPDSNAENEPIEEQEQVITPPADNPSYRETSLKGEQDPLAMSINLNQSALANERAAAGLPNTSSRAFGGKKVKVAPNIKKSICVEETSEVQGDKKGDAASAGAVEKPKVNKDAWLKNYDILKIEYQPLPTATKKETKKLLMEKVYKELWSTNTDIKRTIKKYKNKYLLSIGKKPIDSAEDRMNDSCDSDTNRAKSLTPKTHNNNYSTTAPAKAKVSAFNPGQKSIFYVDNTRDIDNAEIGSDNFRSENFAVQSYTPNGTINQLRQSRDSTKKPSSNKYLVLPKLNLFPDAQAQVQNSFQCWPTATAQNVKPLKPNFMIDLGNKAKFEKFQKGTDRPPNNLLIDGAEMLNMSVGNQTNGARALATYSNKNLYPLTLNPLESIPTSNK